MSLYSLDSSCPHHRKFWTFKSRLQSLIILIGSALIICDQDALAQQRLAQTVFPDNSPLEEPSPLPDLPPAEDFIELPTVPPPSLPEQPTDNSPDTIVVSGFEVVGSSIFSEDELAAITAPYTNRPLSRAELFQVRSAITQRYTEAGYLNSGAFIPPQTLTDGVVEIQVIEGRLAAVNIANSGRLQANYIRSRLALAGGTPFNADRLLEGLRLLQLDPLIETISAELSAGTEPGTSILDVDVKVADTFSLDLVTNNNRSPSVGSWRRGLTVTEDNLLGLGDGLSVGYLNTEGSNEVNLGYTVPINPRNGTVEFSGSFSDSAVIEDPFNFLDIQSESQSYSLRYRQPLIQTPNQELALGLGFSHQRSQTEFLESLIGQAVGFPSPGADAEGRTRVSALRFSQEWTQQGNQEVIALFSEFSLGVDILDATINADAPDSRFFSWRGQAQWVRLLAPETLLLLRGDIQLTGDDLLPLEQFGLGGQQTVRGYRQDLLLTDSGLSLGVETRLPIYRAQNIDGLLQIAPFIDFGAGWNNSTVNPDPNVLLATGIGFVWQQGDQLSARLDWGIPLVGVEKRSNTWQENGIYFSINYTLF